MAKSIYRQLVDRVLLQRCDYYIVNDRVPSSKLTNTEVAAISNNASSPAQAPQQTVTTNNTAAPQPGENPVTSPLPEPTAQISQIRQALRQRRICFYYAFGMKSPYDTCQFNHGQSGLQFGWYRSAVSPNDGEAALAACPCTQADYKVGLP